MKILPWVLFVAPFFLISCSGSGTQATEQAQTKNEEIDSCAHNDRNFHCVEYVRNYDSDTITFNIPKVPKLIGEKINVRVAHIDSPEKNGKLPCEKETARTAKNLVENLLKRAKRIDLLNVKRDKYFRILADVRIDGQDLKEVLLKNKLAYNYEGRTKEKLNWCKRTAESQ